MNCDSLNSLAAPQRKLIEHMQRLNFGRIEAFTVRNGMPVLDPMPKVVRDIKLGGENGPRPELAQKQFELKPQVVDLFMQLNAVGNGFVECLEVKNGLPFRLVVQE